jgi:hypothetical protein
MASTSAYVIHNAWNAMQINATVTCDAGTSTITTTKLPYDMRGWFLFMLRTYPGGTAPTDATDLYIYQHSSTGKDILDGGGVDKIDATSTLTFQPLINSSDNVVPICGDLFIAASNNSVNAAIFTVEMYFIKVGGFH